MTTQHNMITTVNFLMKQLKENPVNWALLAVLAYIVRSYTTPNKPVVESAKHPEVMVFKNYTPFDLLPFDGHDNKKPILMGINGSVYDVTRGRNFYGPEGPYANFAGHDASRGLAKNSFDEDMLVDPKGPIDRLEDLTAEEWESLREWEQHFATKYILVEMSYSFMQLPEELLIKIFSQLPVKDLLKSALVCREWSRLVFDGSLWTTIDVSPFYKSIPIELILKLIKSSGHFLRTANFRGCIQLTGHALRTLSTECPYIEVLIIKDCRGLSTASINHFLQRAMYLKVLDVSGLDTIKSSTLSHSTFQFHSLERLNLSWCRNLTGAGVLNLVQSCSHLTHLKLNGCPQLDNTMHSLGRLLPNLVYLNLAACTSLTDACLSDFFEGNPALQLTHLTLSSCSRLTDTSVRMISLHAKQLTHLELSGCIRLTDHGFAFLCLRLQLVYLDLEDIQQITGATLVSIANHQTQLEHLCLSNCTQISDEDVIQLVTQSHSKHLCHLELDNCTITDRTLLAIADYLVNQPSKILERQQLTIEVLDCSSITEEGIREALVKAGCLLNIKSFYSFLNSGDEEGEESTVTVDEENIAPLMDTIPRLHGVLDSPHSYRNNTAARRRQRRQDVPIVSGSFSQSSPGCIIL
ncbi:hypothetical protein BD560DRAFT_365461 [Blakeslea trispora]|nr:hypothetical protein BD560DRAFT_365461 [Blakeslea trispora]